MQCEGILIHTFINLSLSMLCCCIFVFFLLSAQAQAYPEDIFTALSAHAVAAVRVAQVRRDSGEVPPISFTPRPMFNFSGASAQFRSVTYPSSHPVIPPPSLSLTCIGKAILACFGRLKERVAKDSGSTSGERWLR